MRKTIIKAQPPKIQLRVKDSLAASIPTGKAYVKNYDDLRTLYYGIYSSLEPDPDGFDARKNYNNVNYSSSDLLLWYPIEEFILEGDGFNKYIENKVIIDPLYPARLYCAISPPESQPSISANNVNSSFADKYQKNSVYIPAATGYYNAFLGATEGTILNFYPNKPFSFSAHINLPSTTGIKPIAHRVGLGYFDWQIYVENGQLIARVCNETVSQDLYCYTNDVVIFPNTWHHIVVTFNGTNTFQIYVDGVLKNITHVNNGWTSFTDSTNGTLYLGAMRLYPDTNSSFPTHRSDIYIDQVTIFRRVITQQEVNVLRTARVISGGISFPCGLPRTSVHFKPEFDTDINVSAPLRAGVGDYWVDPNYETFKPFIDHAQPTIYSGSFQNSFYASGTTVTEGFSSPVWSKTKIEIDLTPSSVSSVWVQNNNPSDPNKNFPVCYWDHQEKKFKGIGPGYDFSRYSSTDNKNISTLFQEQCIAFGASMFNGFQTGLSNSSYIVGGPISNYGFPLDPKYHADDNLCIKMSDYIDQPFLLEKAVLYIKINFKQNNYFSTYNLLFITFFLLNQRRPYKTTTAANQNYKIYYAINSNNSDAITNSITNMTYENSIPTSTGIDTIRELITYWQASYNGYNNLSGLNRDFILPNNNTNWTAQLVMSASAKSPVETKTNYIVNVNSKVAYEEKWHFSSRRSIPETNGRDLINSFQSFEKFGTASSYVNLANISRDNILNLQVNFDVSQNPTKINPYLLFPEDRLILGAQIPYPAEGIYSRPALSGGTVVEEQTINNGKGPELVFEMGGVNKLVLYGSYVKNGKEYHKNKELVELSSLSVCGGLCDLR